MKRYRGTLDTTPRGGRVVLVDENEPGESRRLDERQDLYNHSPDGFMWGYGGSGPAQLALALAADVTQSSELALRVYQELKWRVVAHWPQEQEWTATEAELRAVISRILEDGRHPFAGSNT